MSESKVYIVSQGDYSDYTVMCACEDEATANRFRDAYNGDSKYETARVEQLTWCESGAEPQRYTIHRSEVILRDDQSASEARWWSYSGWTFEGWIEQPSVRPKVEYVRAPILNDKAGYLRVIGSTEESVLKVTSERINAFLSGAWCPHLETKK